MSNPTPYRISGVGVENVTQRRQLGDERAKALRQRQSQDRPEKICLCVERQLACNALSLLVTGIAATRRDDRRHGLATDGHELRGFDFQAGHQLAKIREAAKQVCKTAGRDPVNGNWCTLHFDSVDAGAMSTNPTMRSPLQVNVRRRALKRVPPAEGIFEKRKGRKSGPYR